jgi:hypothetical protein
MSNVPIYQSVLTHRKTLKFARLLNLDKFSVVGRLIALWTWCMDNAAADGSLADIEPDILADVYAWDGKPSELVEALLSAGFLEIDDAGHWRIHDWDAYGGKVLERKEANTARMREARRKSRPSPPAETERPRALHVRKLCRAREEESNCVECQATQASCHGVWCLSMALRMVSSLCMQATKATLGGLPCSRSRVEKARRTGL